MKEEDFINDLKARLEDLESERNKFETDWNDAENYVASSVYNWKDLESIPTMPRRFTSKPCKYNQTLVSGLVGYSISPSIKWFALSLEDEKLLKLYGVKDWLEECQTTMISQFNKSNLYSEISPTLTDYTILGHGTLFVGEDLTKDVLHFEHKKANEIFLDTDNYGKVNTVFRKYKMRLDQMVEMFGYDNLPTDLKEEYDDYKRRRNKHTILFAVYPRKNFDYQSKLSKDMPIAAVYIDLDKNIILKESGYKEFPYAVFEYKQVSGYAYSESIAKDALPDIKALNICRDTSLKIAQSAAEPPLKASDHLKNISIRPRSVTRLESPNDVIEAIRIGENYPITLEVVQDYEETVKDIFNVDFFLMLQSSKDKTKTATEVMEMQGEKAAVLSDLIVSLNNALSIIIERSFNLLMRAGKLPTPPESLSREMNVPMKIDFLGPLAQAQKRYYESGTAANAIQQAAPIIQLFPNAGDYINGDQLVKSVLETAGMPQNIIREDKDVEEIRRLRAEQEQAAIAQQQAMEQQKNLMQNLNKLNEPLNSNSVMNNLNQQLAGGMTNAQ